MCYWQSICIPVCDEVNWCSSRCDSTLHKHTLPVSLVEAASARSITENRSLVMAALGGRGERGRGGGCLLRTPLLLNLERACMSPVAPCRCVRV